MVDANMLNDHVICDGGAPGVFGYSTEAKDVTDFKDLHV